MLYASCSVRFCLKKEMFMVETKELLHFAVELGDLMLRNGAEIYRVEDTITMIMKSFDVTDFDVYVLSNGIFASANENREDSCSVVRHVPLGNVNLAKISGYNQIARDLCSHVYSIEEAKEKMMAVNKQAEYPMWMLVLACGIGSGAFGYLFSGSVIDALFACLIGLCEQPAYVFMQRHKFSMFTRTVFSGALICILALIISIYVPSTSFDKIIVGAIMPLVPGIAFTTSIRDFYNEDHLSGTIHLINALLIALCIAVGIFIPLLIFTKFISNGGVLM